jgi:tRNA pseudouridine65 synthase
MTLERIVPAMQATVTPSHGGPLAVIHIDADLLVVFKPAGLLVHATSLDAHERDNALDRLQVQLGPDDSSGLAPAHRLDKGTSGLLVFARHAEAARHLGTAFEQGLVAKRYLALVRGWPDERFDCAHPLARDPELPSQGQPQLPAHTRFRRLGRVSWPFSLDPRHPHSRYALVEAEPLSGRRHQIRRHLKHLAHPIVGDATHGKGPHNRAVAHWLGCSRLWLHAMSLAFPHPASGSMLHLRAGPGTEWQRLVDGEGWLEPVPWPPGRPRP